MNASSQLFTTPLFKEHQKCGAKLASFSGWNMPMQYQSVKDEILAVRKHCGVFDVGHMGLFAFEGDQALEFLDRLLPNKIAKTPEQKAIYSPLCNDRGHILDDLIVYHVRKNFLLMCVNAGNKQKDWDWIQKVSQDLKFDCKITNLSQDYTILAVQGPQSFSILNSIDPELKLADADYYSVQHIQWQNKDCYFARTGYTGEDGFELFIPTELAAKTWTALLEQQVTPCGLAARDTLRIEVGFPLYGQELSESLTPLDCGLKWTVDMSKPDFIGKSALVSHKPARKTIKLVCPKAIPRSGYPVFLGDHQTQVGLVTSGTHSPHLGKGIALVSLDIAQKPIDAKSVTFYIKIRNNFVECNYTLQPFVKGGHK